MVIQQRKWIREKDGFQEGGGMRGWVIVWGGVAWRSDRVEKRVWSERGGSGSWSLAVSDCWVGWLLLRGWGLKYFPVGDLSYMGLVLVGGVFVVCIRSHRISRSYICNWQVPCKSLGLWVVESSWFLLRLVFVCWEALAQPCVFATQSEVVFYTFVFQAQLAIGWVNIFKPVKVFIQGAVAQTELNNKGFVWKGWSEDFFGSFCWVEHSKQPLS